MKFTAAFVAAVVASGALASQDDAQVRPVERVTVTVHCDSITEQCITVEPEQAPGAYAAPEAPTEAPYYGESETPTAYPVDTAEGGVPPPAETEVVPPAETEVAPPAETYPGEAPPAETEVAPPAETYAGEAPPAESGATEVPPAEATPGEEVPPVYTPGEEVPMESSIVEIPPGESATATASESLETTPVEETATAPDEPEATDTDEVETIPEGGEVNGQAKLGGSLVGAVMALIFAL